MKQYKIGEVFEDLEHFDKPKRIKCVEGMYNTACYDCIYHEKNGCLFPLINCDSVIFVETGESLISKKL